MGESPILGGEALQTARGGQKWGLIGPPEEGQAIGLPKNGHFDMPKQGNLSGLNIGLKKVRAIKILKKVVANLTLTANNPGKASGTTPG